MPLANLSNCLVGVDAAYYLDSFLAPPVKEPLLSALGGFPLALEQAIIKDLDALRTAGLKLYFVFNGLDHGIVDDPFGPSIVSARANAAAFKIYDADMANEAIIEFKKTGTRRSQLKPTLAVLIECRVPYFCSFVGIFQESTSGARGTLYCRTIQCFGSGEA